MNGRLENELKIYAGVEEKLKSLPPYVGEWYNNLRASNETASTCRDYINKVNRFLTYLKNTHYLVKLNNITQDQVSQYFREIQVKRVVKNGVEVLESTSDSYRQGVWSCLRRFFDFLKKRGYIDVDLMDSIERPKNNDLARINRSRIEMNKDDFREIASTVSSGVGTAKAKSFQKEMAERDMLMVQIFMNTGMRKTALMSINLDDIDLDKKTLVVVDKGEKIHTYALNDVVVDALQAWLPKRKAILGSSACPALFITNQKKRISGNAIYKIVDKYGSAALNRHIAPHKIRGGFCTIIYNETEDIEFARRAVGHANTQTTQRYIVTANKEKEKAANIMSNVFKK